MESVYWWGSHPLVFVSRNRRWSQRGPVNCACGRKLAPDPQPSVAAPSFMELTVSRAPLLPASALVGGLGACVHFCRILSSL
jgi:hypothetical protein